MNGRTERRVGKILWGTAVLLFLASGLLAGRALYYPPQTPSLEKLADTDSHVDGTGAASMDFSALAKKRMSATVVPPPPPAPPPRRAAVPLGTLIRLAGVMDYGSSPPEAMIEIRKLRQTKSFGVGDTVEGTTAKVEAITDGVILSYDEKRWMLSFKGIKELPSKAGTETGKKPSGTE